MVYILVFNNNPIVLGHGQRNRSKVIFDNENQITSSHLKALFVRLYNLYGNGEFNRYIISCQNKDEAKKIEVKLLPFCIIACVQSLKRNSNIQRYEDGIRDCDILQNILKQEILKLHNSIW